MVQAYKRLVNLIEQSYLVELEGLGSCTLLAQTRKDILEYINSQKEKLVSKKERSLENFSQYYQLLCKLRDMEPVRLEWTETEERLAKLIPFVKTKEVWPSFQGLDRELEIFATRNAAYEAFNFINGKRSVLDIILAIDAEFIDIGGVSHDAVEEYFTALEKTGLVETRNFP